MLVVGHLRKLISLFQKNYLEKLKALFEAIDIALLMTKPTLKLIAKLAFKSAKQKQS